MGITSSSTLIDIYLRDLTTTFCKLPKGEIEQAILWLFDSWKKGNQTFVFGNGGSAATASHIVNDLTKLTAVAGKRRFIASSLTDNMSLITAVSNDLNFEGIFLYQLTDRLKPWDTVIAISTSGNSPNVVAAAKYANRMLANVITLTGDTGGELAKITGICIRVPDSNIYRQEDCHLAIGHIIALGLKDFIANENN